jgi:prevent-host-death family protein
MNTITTSELRRRLRDVLAGLREAAQPFFVMQYSRPVAVLVDIDVYESLQAQALNAHPRIIHHPGISGGEPILVGTRISVREIVERTRAGQSVEEIAEIIPPLTPAVVHEALSYYYDFPLEIERLIEEAEPTRALEMAHLRGEKVASGIVRVRPRTRPAE